MYEGDHLERTAEALGRRLHPHRADVPSLVAAVALVVGLLVATPATAGGHPFREPASPFLNVRFDRVRVLTALQKHPRPADFAPAVVNELFSGAHYKIINVGHLLHVLPDAYPTVTAINQKGQILLSSHDDPQTSVRNDVVDENGFVGTIPTYCPGCDPYYPFVAVAQGLNNVNDIVGYWDDSGGPEPGGHYAGVEWAMWDGAPVGISSASGFYGIENAVNDSGIAVGFVGTEQGGGYPGTAYNYTLNEHLGLYGAANACSAISTTSAISSANAINDAGVVVGDAAPQSNCNGDVAVRFPQHGPAMPLPVRASSIAVAINARGDVVGTANSGGPGAVGFGALAFLYHLGNNAPAGSASAPLYLPFPKGYSATTNSEVARGLNDAGDVVGDIYGYDSNNNFSLVAGFLYTHGRTYDLNALLPPRSGWRIVDAVGINDRGEIVGTGAFKSPYAYSPFVMKPL